jgi:hypothetical protein
VNVKTDIEGLKAEVPHIVVGTPGRILDLATKRNVLDLSHVSPRAACRPPFLQRFLPACGGRSRC